MIIAIILMALAIIAAIGKEYDKSMGHKSESGGWQEWPEE